MNERDQIAAYRALLKWAVDFVERETQVTRLSFMDLNGNFDDADAEVQVVEAERWLAQAREALR